MIRLHLNRRLRVSDHVSFGGGGPRRVEAQQFEQFYAFAIAGGARPRVFTYDTGPDGVEAVANLIRSEEVLAVVRGREAEFSEVSVVELRVAGRRLAHQLPVKIQRY